MAELTTFGDGWRYFIEPPVMSFAATLGYVTALLVVILLADGFRSGVMWLVRALSDVPR